MITFKICYVKKTEINSFEFFTRTLRFRYIKKNLNRHSPLFLYYYYQESFSGVLLKYEKKPSTEETQVQN
jgi:hypothetical protein